MKKYLFSLLAAVLLLSCSGRKNPQQEAGSTVAFRYARLIHVEQRADGSRLVTIDNPWKAGKALHRYLLVPSDVVPSGATVSHQTEHGATVVRVPLRRSIVFTSVHAALAAELGAEEQLAGVADLKYMKVPFVQQGVADGRLVDCGDGMAPLVEKIIDAGADAILLSPFENSGGYGRLEDIDIPLIECAEYMEPSPLARAEWMRFYGMLYGREREADSLFQVVDSCYQALCHEAREAGEGRSVLVDKQTGSVWYMPGGRSTIGQMLQDAGARYPYADDTHSGSLSLPFEAVLERAGESDVWLLRYDADHQLTLAELLREQPGYSQLRPMRELLQTPELRPQTSDSRLQTSDLKTQNSSVYACNVSTSMFYEETPFRPDLLLRDFISIVHGDRADSLTLRYYHPVR